MRKFASSCHIFEKKGLKVPETWPEAIEAAKELHDPKNGQYGFTTTMRRGLYAGWQFWAVHASYGGTWFDKEEKVVGNRRSTLMPAIKRWRC